MYHLIIYMNNLYIFSFPHTNNKKDEYDNINDI